MLPPKIYDWNIFEVGPWFEQLDERQKKEVQLSLTYHEIFNHGTPNHNHYILIAKLAELLNLRVERNKAYEEFIRRFGKFKVAEGCNIEDLPFISDIGAFFDELAEKGK